MEPWKISGTSMPCSSCVLGLVILFQVFKNALSWWTFLLFLFLGMEKMNGILVGGGSR